MNRRKFLAAACAAGAASCTRPEPDRYAKNIRVTGAEVFHLPVQEERYGWTIVRVQTDVGLSGIGEATGSGSGDPAIAKVPEYIEWMTGRSVYDIEALRARTYPEHGEHGRAMASAFSSIEQALYDIQGQAQGAPISALFGGRLRDQIRNYANINRGSKTRTPEGFRPTLESAIEAGFDSTKLAPFDRRPRNASPAELERHFQRGLESIRMARELIGPTGDVLIEGHSNFELDRALGILDALQEQNIFWFEEPIRSLEAMAEIRDAAPFPIAGGEGLFSGAEALNYIQTGAVDILMPDIKWCAGCLELKKISAMCEAAGVQIAPHGPVSPVGNMAAAQVCSTIPNFSILEYSHGDAPWRFEMTDPPEPLQKGGMLDVLDTPGLGYKLNMKTINARKA